MKAKEQAIAAMQFAEIWKNRGDEKQDTQTFWLTLLQKVYGVENPGEYIAFERPVEVDDVRTGKTTTKYIDGYIPSTRVLIEQKGKEINLKKGYQQSDGSILSPYQQARRYGGYLPQKEQPRWIIVCNFQEFQIHDMNRPNDEPEKVLLSDLKKEYHRLQLLVDTGSELIKKEMEVSLQAGELVGQLYDSLLQQYKNPEDEETLKSLNVLCVRLVFCLYAEDSGLFGRPKMFHDYLKEYDVRHLRKALVELFSVLDTTPEERDPYLKDDNPSLAEFPYVNGGLFADESIEIPPFTEEIRELLLGNASENFDWSGISPTIFGAVFESTLNPETRRSGGMHYTSIENIHKVIDPLFLNDLQTELDSICSDNVIKSRDAKLRAFQDKLSQLKFFDPACGSGNFLTETYISLRRMENDVIRMLIDSQKGILKNQITLGFEGSLNPIKVSISQFYGIEINDFAVTVAKTALWIAEAQMMAETEAIVHMNLDFLPLKTYANIVEGNALRMDWENVIPRDKLNYIMGNPPFVGARQKKEEDKQKQDIKSIFKDIAKAGNLDYVSCWYKKAVDIMAGTKIKAAFVSTNSITQGEQVPILWSELLKNNICIDFAYRTFRWDSEANLKAHVHCVIIGFCTYESGKSKLLYDGNQMKLVKHINPYLLDLEDVLIYSRTKPLCQVPKMKYGNLCGNTENFILTESQREEIIRKEPALEKFIKPYIGSEEYINGKMRYCFWLVNATPKDIVSSPELHRRVKQIKEYRSNPEKPAATRRKADVPHLFFSISQPNDDYILMPRTSSENRRYIPIGFVSPDIIASDACEIIADASIYHFGILTSNVHMAWMRTVAGRLKSDYRYSKDIVYNNFPWPSPTGEQKAKIEVTAQAILDARALYPDSSLADLYDEAVMPSELRKAHQNNDRAVMDAYGFWGKLNSEKECVAELMKMYQNMIQNKK